MRPAPGILRLLLSAAIGLSAPRALAADPPASAGADQELAAARLASEVYQDHLASLIDATRSPRLATRIEAISALGRLDDDSVVPVLIPFLRSGLHDDQEILAALAALRGRRSEAAVAPARSLLASGDPQVRAAALAFLEHAAAVTAQDAKTHVDDADAAVRASAYATLSRGQVADATAVLAHGLAFDDQAQVRQICAIGLGLMGDRSQGPALIDALSDADPGVRRYAAEALVKLSYTPAIPALLMALEANVAGTHLARCLRLLSGQDFGFDAHAPALDRAAAVERGFQWWTANAKDLDR